MTLYAAYQDWILGVAGWLDVTSGQVYDDVPTYIRLAEIELDKELRLRQAIRHVSNTIDNDGILTLPDDFSQMKVLTLDLDGRTLDAITLDRYGDAYRRSGGTGAAGGIQDGYPVYYAINGNRLQFFPLGAELDISMSYYRKAQPLSAQVPENIYSIYAPETLLAGAVMYGMRALFEEERMSMWKNKFEEDIITLNSRSQKEELGSSPLVMRPPLRQRVRGYR